MPGRSRICLIDDDQFVRDALCLGLSDAGYEIESADSGKAALDLIANGSFDAVVTDINMPGFSGADLITALRAQHADLPIVAISGGGEINGRNVMEIARENGAAACLVKPFRARDIAAALSKILSDSI